MNTKDSLPRHLQRAFGAPSELQLKSSGAALALALHCICVRKGLCTHPKQRGGPNQLPKDWNSAGNEWVFQYRHPGLAHTVVLHCAVQEATGRMYLQLREETSAGCVYPLGLTVGRYIPDAANLQHSRWEGLLTQQDALEQQLDEFCLGPILREAANAEEGQEGWFGSCSSMLQDAYQNLQDRLCEPTVLIGLGGIAAVGILLYWRSQRTHHVPHLRHHLQAHL